MKRRTPNEIVGIAVLIAAVILILMTLWIRKMALASMRDMNIRFDQVIGLQPGAPIFVLGVQAGQVINIGYDPDSNPERPVLIVAEIKRDIRIYENAHVKITQTGIIGDKRIELEPGSPSKPLVPDGGTLLADPQFNMDKTMAEVQTVVADLAQSTRAIRNILDPETVGNVRKTMASLEKGLTNINDILEKNRPGIDASIENVRNLTANANAAAERSNKLLESISTELEENRPLFPGILTTLQSDVQTLSTKVGALAEEATRTAAESRRLLEDINRTSEPLLRNLNTTAENAAAISTTIRQGQGTIGRLLNDPGPFNDFAKVARSMRRAFLGTTPTESSIPYEGEEAQEEPAAPTPAAPTPAPAAK